MILAELLNLRSVLTSGPNIKLHSHKVGLVLRIVVQAHQRLRTSPTGLVGELKGELALENVLPLNVYTLDIGRWDHVAAIPSYRLRLNILLGFDYLN